MIRIHKFITEDDVNYYKKKSNEYIKELLENTFQGHREIIGLPSGDIDVLLEEFREDNFTKYQRRTGWRSTNVKVLNNDGTVNTFDSKIARFNFINKWNQEEESYQKYMIIVDKNNKILWLGTCNNIQHFISVGDKIYEVQYTHKELVLFPNICCEEDIYFSEKDEENSDSLIRKYYKNVNTIKCDSIKNARDIFQKEKIKISITLDDYFEKGFFYKGHKWNTNWDKYYGYKYITILIRIFDKNGLFCFEIENITYPHYGYMLLDLEKLEIVEARKELITNYLNP